MRVLLVSYQDRRSMGGALSMLETTAESLAGLGHAVEVLFVYKGKESIGANSAFKVTYLRSRSALYVPALIRFIRLVNNGRYDIIHFLDPINILSVLSCLLHRSTILHVHGREWGIPFYLNMICRLRAHLSAAIISITFGAKRSLVEMGLARPSKISVIPNAVHHRFFDFFTAATSCNQDPTVMNKVSLGFAARHNDCKSPEEAVKLMMLLPSRYTLLIAGEGEQTTFLKQEVARLNLGHRISFVGSISDMTLFFAKLDFYLFFSKYEPFGLVIAEAMASFVPVVGLRGEGEYFEPEYPLVDSTTALLLPRVDPFLGLDQSASHEELQSLANAIQMLEADSSRRNSIVQAARHRVETCFHPDRYGEELEALYRAVCGQPDTRPLPHYPQQCRFVI